MEFTKEEYRDIEMFIELFTKRLIIKPKIPFNYSFKGKKFNIKLNIEKK